MAPPGSASNDLMAKLARRRQLSEGNLASNIATFNKSNDDDLSPVAQSTSTKTDTTQTTSIDSDVTSISKTTTNTTTKPTEVTISSESTKNNVYDNKTDKKPSADASKAEKDVLNSSLHEKDGNDHVVPIEEPPSPSKSNIWKAKAKADRAFFKIDSSRNVKKPSTNINDGIQVDHTISIPNIDNSDNRSNGYIKTPNENLTAPNDSLRVSTLSESEQQQQQERNFPKKPLESSTNSGISEMQAAMERRRRIADGTLPAPIMKPISSAATKTATNNLDEQRTSPSETQKSSMQSQGSLNEKTNISSDVSHVGNSSTSPNSSQTNNSTAVKQEPINENDSLNHAEPDNHDSDNASVRSDANGKRSQQVKSHERLNDGDGDENSEEEVSEIDNFDDRNDEKPHSLLIEEGNLKKKDDETEEEEDSSDDDGDEEEVDEDDNDEEIIVEDGQSEDDDDDEEIVEEEEESDDDDDEEEEDEEEEETEEDSDDDDEEGEESDDDDNKKKKAVPTLAPIAEDPVAEVKAYEEYVAEQKDSMTGGKVNHTSFYEHIQNNDDSLECGKQEQHQETQQKETDQENYRNDDSIVQTNDEGENVENKDLRQESTQSIDHFDEKNKPININENVINQSNTNDKDNAAAHVVSSTTIAPTTYVGSQKSPNTKDPKSSTGGELAIEGIFWPYDEPPPVVPKGINEQDVDEEQMNEELLEDPMDDGKFPISEIQTCDTQLMGMTDDSDLEAGITFDDGNENNNKSFNNNPNKFNNNNNNDNQNDNDITNVETKSPNVNNTNDSGSEKKNLKNDNDTIPKKWLCCCLFIGVTIISGALGYLIVYLISGGSNDKGKTNINNNNNNIIILRTPTASPINAPASRPTSGPALSTPISPNGLPDRTYQLLCPLLEENCFVLSNATLPQGQAYSWLTNKDDANANPNLNSYTDVQIIQRFALATLYYSTNGDQWINRNRWMTSDNECDWYTSASYLPCVNGIDLSGLELDKNGLRGSIPSELGLLTSLQYLTLTSDGAATSIQLDIITPPALDGTLPTELGALTNLERVRLADNRLTGTIPTEIQSWSKVLSIDLSLNAFASFPTTVTSLTTLKILDLSNNGLQGPIPNDIGNMSSLTALYLGENSLTGSIPSTIGSLVQLQEALDLTSNALSGSLPSQLGQLTELQRLLLGNNTFVGSLPSQLSLLANLLEIRIEGNPLTGPVPAEFCQTLSFINPSSFADCDTLGDTGSCFTFCCTDGSSCTCQYESTDPLRCVK